MNITITPKTLHTAKILRMAFDRLAVLDLNYCYIIPILKYGEIIGHITFDPFSPKPTTKYMEVQK